MGPGEHGCRAPHGLGAHPVLPAGWHLTYVGILLSRAPAGVVGVLVTGGWRLSQRGRGFAGLGSPLPPLTEGPTALGLRVSGSSEVCSLQKMLKHRRV